LGQAGHRGRAPVDVRPGATIGGDHPAEHEFVAGGRDQAPVDPGLVGPVPNPRRVGPSPAEQLDRLDQHRLSSAGRAREGGHARGEHERGALDHAEVLDVQFGQHTRSSTAPVGQPAADHDGVMPASAHFYEPKDGHGLRHNPLNSIVAPRPIGWISTVGADGVFNLAPYSFFNLYAYSPPIVGFTSSEWKDSAANAAVTCEFCWNLATRPLAEAMNQSSAHVAPDVDEFALAGLTPAVSRLVAAPHVAESPV